MKIRGAIPHSSPYVFMAWCFIKDRDIFTYYCYYSSTEYVLGYIGKAGQPYV